MSDSEKVVWFKVFTVMLGFPMVWVLIMALAGTDEGRVAGVLAFAVISIGMCLATLLILTWRLAYLAGRGER